MQEKIFWQWRSFSGREMNTRLVHYEGCVWNREYEAITDMESRMYAKPAEIADICESDPKKPYISCEYMHAMGNSCGGMSCTQILRTDTRSIREVLFGIILTRPQSVSMNLGKPYFLMERF